jgi:predicted dienelactone hydrolase
MNVSPMKQVRLARRIFRAIRVVAMLGVLGIAALLGSLWLERKSDTTLPTPTGPFAVGRATHVWSDATHADSFAPQPGTKRELLAWIWYPAVARQSPPTVEDYLPSPLRTATERGRVALINLLTRDLSRVRAHSIRDSDVSPQQRSYPVVVMMGALGFTTLAEDLASHGYVVVSVEAPYRSGLVVFPDGRVIRGLPQNNPETVAGPQKEQLAIRLQGAASADIGFALDQLERLNASDPSGKFLGRLDLQRVGVFGHSLGGAIALQFCHDDSRCKAVIDVDGAPHGSVIGEGVTQPLMFLVSDHGSASDADSRQIKANIRSIFDRLPSDRRLHIMIQDANHYSFSDDAMLKSQLVRGTLHTLGILGIDGRRQVVVSAHCIHSFFDVYLKGAPASGLKSQPEYPEIQYVD